MSDLRTLRALLVTLTALTAPAVAHSGNFDISPVRLTLSQDLPTGMLTLRNLSDEPVVIQAELMKWKAPEKYTRTKELLVNPPIFTVAPQSSQIVRVGMGGLLTPQEELAYRLYLEEIPPAPKKGIGELRTALRIGVPIFIPPKEVRKEIVWRVRRKRDGQFRIDASNRGNLHIQVLDIRLSYSASNALSRNVRQYLLPGQTHHWTVRPTSTWKGPQPGEKLLITAHTDEGDRHANVPVEAH